MIEKLKEWAGSGIVGGVAFAAFTAVVSLLTGSWTVVRLFVKSHFWESLSCALVVLGAGIIIGLAIRGHIDRKKIAAKDTEIADLRERPEQSAEEQKVKSILVSLDPDKLGLVGMVLARGSIDEHAEKGNRAFLVESGILARVEPSAIEAFASYTLTSIASAVIAGDEALKESAMKQGRELAGRIEERSERAREELNAQRRLTEIAARVPELERRAETAEAKLKEYDAEASKLAEDNRILHMDYLTKGLLYAIATGEEFKTRDDDPSYLSRNAKNLEAFQKLLQMGLANYETCSMHELRWFGTELAAKLVEEHSDLFGKAKEEVEEIRRKEGAA